MLFEDEPSPFDHGFGLGFIGREDQDIDPGFYQGAFGWVPWLNGRQVDTALHFPERGAPDRGGWPDNAINIQPLLEPGGAFGHKPLTPEQTRSGYARMFGVDQSQVGPDMRLRLVSEQPGQNGLAGREDSPYRGYGAPDDIPPPPDAPRRGPVAPGMGVSESEQGPMNEPYDPESPAVRGRDGMPLPYDLKDRVRGYLQGTKFESMDLDGVQIHTEHAPWYLPSDKDAMTMENHIYVRPRDPSEPAFNPMENRDDMKLFLEEIAHAGQFQDGMTRPGYLWESLMHGYRDNEYEKEARGIASKVGVIPSTPPLESRTLTE